MNGHYEIGDVVLDHWTLTRFIGAGSYGRVYKAVREDFGIRYTAAVKIITVPQNQSEIADARFEGMDEKSVADYFRSFVEEIAQELGVMSRLKGTANIVGYEDHAVVPHESGIGWDIIIRMELLTPLMDYFGVHAPTQENILHLGVDLCRALELCRKDRIVHRDIKPQNIFISQRGDFKLGDFGIARTVEKTTGGLSKKGTYTYMAPEVYKEAPYNASVDIYSLGIAMYSLLNDNRSPFLPAYPAPISHSGREAALAKRMSGAPLPPPKNADERLTKIILKACAFAPGDRYDDPAKMRRELEAILYNRAAPAAPAADTPAEASPAAAENTQTVRVRTPAMAQDRKMPNSAPQNSRREAPASRQTIISGSAPQEPETLPAAPFAAGCAYTAGVRSDGTVVAVGDNEYGQCNVRSWKNIIALASGGCHTVGLRSDGTVTAAGWNEYRQCEAKYWSDIIAVAAGRYHTVGLRENGFVVAVGSSSSGQCRVQQWFGITAIAAGWQTTMGLKKDGTVVAAGDNTYGQCKVSGWSEITAIAAGASHTVGLRKNGTVVAAGSNSYGERNVDSWRNIVAIAAGEYFTVGLKSDGTVVATGYNYDCQCQTGKWSNIVAIAAGSGHTVGLKADGTVVATGDNGFGQCRAADWENISTVCCRAAKLRQSRLASVGRGDLLVAAGAEHTAVLRQDGTVIAVGDNHSGQCEVKSWRNMVAIAVGYSHTVGLRKNGTVAAVGLNNYGQCEVADWKEITAIAAGNSHTVGLRADGTVVATGDNWDGQCDVEGWSEVVAIAVGYGHTVGLRADGSFLSTKEQNRRFRSKAE